MKIKKLKVKFEIDIGAPIPTIIANEEKTYLIFYRFQYYNTERGLSMEAINVVINSTTIIITTLLYSAFYLALIYYVYKKKDYFLNHDANPTKQKR